MWMMGLHLWVLPLTGQTSAQKKVEEAVEVFRKLLIDPEQKGLEFILSPSVSYGHSSGRVENRNQCIENLMNGNSDFVSVEFNDQSIYCYHKTAIVRHNLVAQTNDKGVAGQVKLHVMTTWIKEGKNWRLLARQAVKI